VPTENEADALLQVATLIPLGVLTVSNGRSAIWSGACSSGGSKTTSCTFTINGAASVSANVQ